MQIELDPATGLVTFTLAAFQELLNAKQAPAFPPLFVLDVQSDSNVHKTYKVFIWFDAEGKHFFCSCPHHEHRGAFCKHLQHAEMIRTLPERAHLS